MKFIGSEGVMTTGYDGVSIERTPQPDEFDGTIETFAAATRKSLTGDWNQKHASPDTRIRQGNVQSFDTSDVNAQLEHHKNFYRSIREDAPMVEDATFGLRAAAPALLTNESLFQRKIMNWNPQTLEAVTLS